jgi:hypothetical protein
VTERTDRLRTLRLHVIVALGALMVLIVVNFLTMPQYPWWIYVLMVWMPAVAIHTAWAMELFGSKQGNRSGTETQRKP